MDGTKKRGEVSLPPLHLGQSEVNHKVGIGYLHTNFEGGLEADFIVVLGIPQGEVFLIGEQVSAVEEITEVGANDAVCTSQAGNCNNTDVSTGVDDVTISKALQIHLVVHDTSVGFERSNQGAEVGPSAEDYEVVAGQNGLRDLVVDVIKYLNGVASCD